MHGLQFSRSLRTGGAGSLASIFLSYAREDFAKAQRIAKALEAVGHSVWWDRQLQPGERFAAEIDKALKSADAVVALWSRASIESAWVQDEAGVGRDSGRLVPALLEPVEPPLGFRQYHAIDLSRARLSARSTEQLARAVEDRISGKRNQAVGSARPGPRRDVRRLRRPLLLGVSAILVLAAIVAGAFWLWRSAGTPDRPQIAIRPADESALSRQVARDLLLGIPNLAGADASAYQLVDASQASAKAEAVLTIDAASSGARERRDLVLRAPNNAILWSASIDRPSAASTNLPQQLAIKAQRALYCAAEALSYRRERIGQDTLRLYLSACTNFDDAYGTNLNISREIKIFEQVLTKAPHFEAAWVKLLVSELDYLEGAAERHGLLLNIRAQTKRAQKLGLDFGELYAARRVWVLPTDFIGIFHAFDEGMNRFPNNANLYRMRAERSWYVGRMSDAVELSAQAVQLDPLSLANQMTLVRAYAYAGNLDAASAQLQKAEQLWPGARTIVSARYGLNFRYGDPKEALAHLQGSSGSGGLHSQQVAFLKARIDPSPANIERSIAEDRRIYEQDPNFIAQIVQTLAQFGRKDEVIDIMLHYGGGPVAGIEAEVLFRPAMRDVWRDPRSIAAAAHLGLLYYWKTSDNWPDFCSDPKLPYDCKKEAAKYNVQKLSVAPAKK